MGALFYRLRVKSGNSAANAVSARIKRRRASSTFRSFFFIAGRFILTATPKNYRTMPGLCLGTFKAVGRERARYANTFTIVT
jgi:hypothetical protein